MPDRSTGSDILTLEAADLAILTTDREGVVQSFNPAAARRFGRAPESVIGRSIDTSFGLSTAAGPGTERGEGSVGLQALRTAARGRPLSIVPPGEREDQAFRATAMVSALRDDAGEAKGYLLICPDDAAAAGPRPGASPRAEDLERARVALETSEQRFRLLVEGVKDYAFILLDPEGRIASWNEGARRVTGYADYDILGEPMELFYTPEDRAAGKPAHLLRCAARDGRVEDEGVRVRKDGTRFEADVVVAALHHPSGEHLGFAKVTRDTTERRSLERRLHQSEKMEAIGRLAGGIAHDFNNVIGAISGFSSLARKQLPADHPVQPRLVQIDRAAERAAGLTRQMLAFGRRQVLHPRALDLNAEVEASAEMLRRLIGENIRVVVRADADLGAVMADPTQLQQVLMNLAINARDAMPSGGTLAIETANVELHEEVARRQGAARPGRYVMLVLTDTGIGMDESTRARVFEPFFTTKPEGKGTGLGLATVYGIVKQSGGFIWLDSQPGEGATFKVYLPRVDAAAEPRAEAGPPAVAQTGTETVLLVEDQEALRDVVRELLEDLGYTVLDTSDVYDALEVARKHQGPIHLLLSDVVMPGMGGGDLARAVVEARPGIRTLFMSGYTNGAVEDRGMSGEEVEVLEKPFDSTTLAQAVRKALELDR